MGDRIGLRPRLQVDLADRKPPAQLQKPRRRQRILPGLALAQKIDDEIGPLSLLKHDGRSASEFSQNRRAGRAPR